MGRQLGVAATAVLDENDAQNTHLLDQFAGNELREVKTTYLNTYAKYVDTRKQLIKLKTDETETVQRIDLLTFQIQVLCCLQAYHY